MVAADSGSSQKLKETAARLASEGARVELGAHGPDTFANIDMLLLSPGVPHTLAPFETVRKSGLPVLGEIEFASRFVSEPVVAVTGTNGKTTVTTLLGDMLQRSGFKTFVGGNIGTPLIDYVDSEKKADRIVLELSSFQLDTIHTFRAQTAVLLNVTDDHMDRYPDFEAYVASKARIFENQTSEDFAVLNGSDPAAVEIAKGLKARKRFFFCSAQAAAGSVEQFAVVQGRSRDGAPSILVRFEGGEGMNFDLSSFSPPGAHNRANAAAAILAALSAGASREAVQSALDDFRGLPHRLEKVATANGVDFIDDSKATNADAAVKAVETFDRPLAPILGGRDKDGDFSALRDVLIKKVASNDVRSLVLLGEAAEKLARVLDGVASIERATSMVDAVRKAFQSCPPGGVVLLAPACASFDMYENYKKRGEDFARIARALAREKTDGEQAPVKGGISR